MKILITICARGGSKGIPGKNIKELNGKPLIWYTINIAKRFARKYIDVDIALSTDSEDIKNAAAECGLFSNYTRPKSLSGDKTGKIDTIADILKYSEELRGRFDYILDLDVTSPLRTLNDLEEAFNIIKSDNDAINLFSVSPSNRSPYFNMVEKKENGYYDKVKSVGDVFSRQTAPKVYDLNASFYFYKRVFFDLEYNGAITDKSLIYEVPHTCFDLDHLIDFEIISYLLDHNKLDFEL